MQIAKNKIGWIIIGVLILLILSYLREGFFLTINSLINGNWTNSNFVSLKELLSSFSNEELKKIKWLATAVFSLGFISLTLIFCYKIFENKRYIIYLSIFYLLLILISLIVALIGFTFFNFSDVYSLVRLIMGAIQSPLFFLISIPLLYYINNNI